MLKSSFQIRPSRTISQSPLPGIAILQLYCSSKNAAVVYCSSKNVLQCSIFELTQLKSKVYYNGWC